MSKSAKIGSNLENKTIDKEIEEMDDFEADASDVIEIYAEAQNLKQAIENAGYSV